MSLRPISPLRQRMLEDMAVRKFGDKTRHDYIRHVETFTAFLGRSPDRSQGARSLALRPSRLPQLLRAKKTRLLWGHWHRR